MLCKDVKLGLYNSYPQLTGDFYRSQITIFHAKKSLNEMIFNHLPSHIDVVGHSLDQTGFGKQGTQAVAGPVPTTLLLNPELWEIHNICHHPFHVVYPNVAWVIQQLSGWALDKLKTQSLGDDMIPLHSLHHICDNLHQVHHSQLYNQVTPVNPVPSRLIEALDKLDLIALVIHHIPATSAQSPILYLWDGTTNGLCSLPSPDRVTSQLQAAVAMAEPLLCGASAPAPQVTYQGQLAGCAIALTTFEAQPHALYLGRYRPGTWVRVRSVGAAARDGATVQMRMRPDTQIAALQPYCK
jgi:hypothetical protein